MKGIVIGPWVLLLLFSGIPLVRGATYFIDGRMTSSIELEVTEKVECPKGLNYFQYQVVKPTSHESKTYSQRVKDFSVRYLPDPSQHSNEQDPFGNRILVTKWLQPFGRIHVHTRLRIENEVDLQPLISHSPYPLPSLPEETRPFLRSTAQVQSDHPEITQLSNRLTERAGGGHEAIARCLNWIVDHITYTLQPERFDALYTLQAGRGNCQNFSHLAAALLRAAGIPTRIITGITLKEPWKVLYRDRTWTLNLATGHHAWIEAYFPDLGWIPYDAQQTHHFVSTRYVRREIGIDTRSASSDGYARWKGQASSSPKLEETIEARFLLDHNTVRSSNHLPDPKNNLFASLIRLERPIPAPAVPKPILPPELPKPPPTTARLPMEEILKLPFTVPVEFGNLDFPEVIDIFAEASKDQEGGAKKSFVVESAEYVTSREAYAQAFRVDTPMKLSDISLALHKFGGTRGELWIELLEEKDGVLVPSGAKSRPIQVRDIPYFHGYRWVVFGFPAGIILLPDRYWIVLRYSGDPIVNWFYIFGNPYGGPDDTRSSPLGEKEEWKNTLNFDFNFRVRGFQPKG